MRQIIIPVCKYPTYRQKHYYIFIRISTNLGLSHARLCNFTVLFHKSLSPTFVCLFFDSDPLDNVAQLTSTECFNITIHDKRGNRKEGNKGKSTVPHQGLVLTAVFSVHPRLDTVIKAWIRLVCP